MRAGDSSSSWARSWGSTGRSATRTMASRARTDSLRPTSAVIGVGPRQDEVDVGRVAHPRDGDLAERLGLVEIDQALLAQLEHGQEAHDDLEPLDQVGGEPAERDR